MRTLRQLAEFVGHVHSGVREFSVQTLDTYLFTNTKSLRATIQKFESLPAPFNFTLDVKPRNGSAPLLVRTRYASIVGVHIAGKPTVEDGFWVFRDGQVIRRIPSFTGFDHTFQDGGQYVVRGVAQGVGRDGYARVAKTVTVNVEGQPQPQPSTFSRVEIFNCHTDHREVHIWVNDGTAGTGWRESGVHEAQYDNSGNCPSGDPFAVQLEPGHVYEIVCVDVDGIACKNNDPTELGCRRLHIVATGGANKPSWQVQVV